MKLKCSECGCKFERKALLKKHIKVHSSPKMSDEYACPFCSVAFSSAVKLRQHQKGCEKMKNAGSIQENHNHTDRKPSGKIKKGRKSIKSKEDHCSEKPSLAKFVSQKSTTSGISKLIQDNETMQAENEPDIDLILSCSSENENDSVKPRRGRRKGTLAKSVKKEQNVACEKCNKAFTHERYLVRHLRHTSCSMPASFECHECNKKFIRKEHLNAHLLLHSGIVIKREKKFQCDVCNKSFVSQSSLSIHMRIHTGEKPFQCEFCPMKFITDNALRKHNRKHTGEKPFSCPECGKSFSLKGTMEKHQFVHSGFRPFKCSYCPKEFIQIGGLNAHLFYHTGQNGFKCDECGKVFNRKARLKSHIQYVHLKIRPFACEECSKTFGRKDDLIRHSLIHREEKIYVCPTCSRGFSAKGALRFHILTHTKEEPQPCPECGRFYLRKDGLIRHVWKYHCNIKDKTLSNSKQDEKSTDYIDGMNNYQMFSREELCENVEKILKFVVEEKTLIQLGWSKKPVDEVLEEVIRHFGHTPVCTDDYSFMDRMRENAKLLFTTVIDDNSVNLLLNNKTVDEVILHVLRLSK